jgi:hypothetical protein
MHDPDHDASPLGREAVCSTPWLLDDPEDDLNNLDDAGSIPPA